MGGMASGGTTAATGAGDMSGMGAIGNTMNMPLNSVGGALQVMDFMMNAMPSKNSGVPNMGVGQATTGGGGQMVQQQQKKPAPGSYTAKNTSKTVTRGVNRGVNMGINRSLGQAMRHLRF